MNAARATPKTGFKFMLAVNRGPDKGVCYQLLPPKVTIGRAPENNVTVNDPRVSRQAAVIEFSVEKITIQDLSKRNALSVNGDTSASASLVDGDIIQIGDTEMVFMVEALPLAAPPKPTGPRLDLVAPSHPSQPLAQAPAGSPHAFAPPPSFDSPPLGFPPPASGPRSRSKTGNDNGKLRFYLIVGVVLALVVWLLNSSPSEKKEEPGIRTVEEIQKDIEGSEKRQEDIAKRRTFKSEDERTRFEEANRHYLEGFRDYQKGQYTRAMRSFETARAIDPNHELARRYYRLAEKQRDEMIAMLILEGRRYKEKQMYARCSAALEKVLFAIMNKDDLKYKEAEALKNECDLMVDEKFQ